MDDENDLSGVRVDIVGALTARDQRRVLVDHRVEERPCLVVLRILRTDQLALELCAELASRTVGRSGIRVHAPPPLHPRVAQGCRPRGRASTYWTQKTRSLFPLE